MIAKEQRDRHGLLFTEFLNKEEMGLSNGFRISKVRRTPSYGREP